MNCKPPVMAALALVSSLAGSTFAQDPIATVENGCASEIETYCSQVTPGEGRMLACFYAHEDKLSGRCQYALYTASAELEAAVSALDYVATECRADIVQLCGDVRIGEGRVVECLESNSESVSEPCKQAIADVID